MYRAFRLLRTAAAISPSDAQVRSLLEEASVTVSITSTPPGADVYVNAALDESSPREHLGRTPLRIRLPLEQLRLRAERPGFVPREILFGPVLRRVGISMTPAPSPRPGMIELPGGDAQFLDHFVTLDPYWVQGRRVRDTPESHVCVARERVLERMEISGPVSSPFRDYRQERPVGDEAYSVIAGMYRVPASPVDGRIERRHENSRDWTIEEVSYAGAGAGERLKGLLYVPRSTVPPYQTVIFVPGANAWMRRASFNPDEIDSRQVLFLVRSGRAMLVPMYWGTYERFVKAENFLRGRFREILLHTAGEIQRSVEYLVQRPDIDGSKIAYYGLSSGAAVGPVMTAVEPRFAAAVLFGGGLYPWRFPAESDAFNFLPRVRLPTLMLNGRHDYFFSYETSQVPMYERLGAREKKHRVFPSGHIPTERAECIREVLDWLDKYLGPVKQP